MKRRVRWEDAAEYFRRAMEAPAGSELRKIRLGHFHLIAWAGNYNKIAGYLKRGRPKGAKDREHDPAEIAAREAKGDVKGIKRAVKRLRQSTEK